MIKVIDLTRRYDDFVAVDRVSFEIQQGEIVGLLGHNGAGKTTIMRMLTGYLEPSAGAFEVDGDDGIDARLSIQEKVGYLPESNSLYPDLTVIDYLFYVANLRGLAKPGDHIKKALELTSLVDKKTQKVRTLSRGYRQRVGVAQAILHRPKILILDEPTNGLDPGQIQQMRSLIKSFGQTATVILSTHVLQEVEAICDRVIIIQRGQVALDERLAELQKSHCILLIVAAGNDKIKNVLQKINGIKKIDQISLTESKEQHFTLTLATDNWQEVANQVAQQVVQQGIPLYSIQPIRRNLETVFRELNQVRTEALNQGGVSNAA